MAKPPHVTVLFCEDVRQELNNKQSFIGVFGPTMNFPVLPARLEKIVAAVLVEVFEPEPLSLSLNVDFDWKDAPDGVAPNIIEVDKPDDSDNRYNAHFLLQFSNLVINGPGHMRVHTEIGGTVNDSSVEFRLNEGMAYAEPRTLNISREPRPSS